MRGSEHKQFWCTHPGCDKVFNRRDYLERHATNHLKVKPFMCVQCNRHFSRKDLYDNHLTTKRHARVTHEVEQANYESQMGQFSQLGESLGSADAMLNGAGNGSGASNNGSSGQLGIATSSSNGISASNPDEWDSFGGGSMTQLPQNLLNNNPYDGQQLAALRQQQNHQLLQLQQHHQQETHRLQQHQHLQQQQLRQQHESQNSSMPYGGVNDYDLSAFAQASSSDLGPTGDVGLANSNLNQSIHPAMLAKQQGFNYSSELASRRRYDEYEQPGLPIYAPPIKQPLHLSGPGPGGLSISGGSAGGSAGSGGLGHPGQFGQHSDGYGHGLGVGSGASRTGLGRPDIGTPGATDRPLFATGVINGSTVGSAMGAAGSGGMVGPGGEPNFGSAPPYGYYDTNRGRFSIDLEYGDPAAMMSGGLTSSTGPDMDSAWQAAPSVTSGGSGPSSTAGSLMVAVQNGSRYGRLPSLASSNSSTSDALNNLMKRYDTQSEAGRFSSYGVSLGLASTISASSRSENGSSDDFSSDADGSSTASLVGDRLRRDMAENPSLIELREQDDPLKQKPLVTDGGSNYEAQFGAGSPVRPLVATKSLEDITASMSHNGIDSVTSSAGAEKERSPTDIVARVSGDARFAWFFDDIFETDKAKLGYDRWYSDAVEAYQLRMEDFREGPLAPRRSSGSVPLNKPGALGRNRSSEASSSTVTGSLSGTSTITDSVPSIESASSIKSGLMMSGGGAPRESDKSDNGSTLKTSAEAAEKLVGARASGEVASMKTVGCDYDRGHNADFLLHYPNMTKALSPDRAEAVLSVLRESSMELESLDAVSDWIQTALLMAEPITYILHPATFDPNNVHFSLLIVLALVGMALSEDPAVAAAARRAYGPGFLYVYESLSQVPMNLAPSKLDLPSVNVLQAFSLLLRYEGLIVMGDGSQLFCGASSASTSAGNKTSPGNYAMNLFLNKALSAVPHVGEFSTPSKHQPIWATISTEGYLFHQGADRDAQWREWSLIESVKRVVHFALYSDAIATLATPKPNPVSIFNMDIHMVCPEPAWQANGVKEFFHIFGQSGVVANVPYLGLIKSLIRFPRMAQTDDMGQPEHPPPQVRAPWSRFALKVVAHGLITIVGKLSGLVPHSDDMLQAVIQSRTDPDNPTGVFSKFNRQLQARLYRGLDVWFHYFSAAYGNVTDRILQLGGSSSLPLTEEFDVTQHDAEHRGVPQYALVIVLCHYSSFIFVNEDLPVVLQVTANLKSWLEAHQSTSLQMLLDYLYMPLYRNWIQTDEAKGMVSASTLYLMWNQAIAGNSLAGNHMFLSAMVYISAVVVWLCDCASNEKDKPLPELRLENFEFMNDSVEYLHALYKHMSGQGPAPENRAINAVLLMSACLLYKRRATKPLVKMLIELLSVMDSGISQQTLVQTVKASRKVYDERAAEARQTVFCAPPSTAVDADEAKLLTAPNVVAVRAAAASPSDIASPMAGSPVLGAPSPVNGSPDQATSPGQLTSASPTGIPPAALSPTRSPSPPPAPDSIVSSVPDLKTDTLVKAKEEEELAKATKADERYEDHFKKPACDVNTPNAIFGGSIVDIEVPDPGTASGSFSPGEHTSWDTPRPGVAEEDPVDIQDGVILDPLGGQMSATSPGLADSDADMDMDSDMANVSDLD